MTEQIETDIRNLDFYYAGNIHALKKVSFTVYKNNVTALIGLSGCRKTTLLRYFNRMHDLYLKNRYEGEIFFKDTHILSNTTDIINLRSLISMVFQKLTSFPMTIFDNIAYGLRLKGIKNLSELTERVEATLRQAALWDEGKDKLNVSAYELYGGQQERLCIAGALAVKPEVLLFNEPTSTLDPLSTGKIEEFAINLKKDITLIIVTQKHATGCEDIRLDRAHDAWRVN